MLWWVQLEDGSARSFEAPLNRRAAATLADSIWAGVLYVQSDLDRRQEAEEQSIAERHKRLGWREDPDEDDDARDCA